MNEATADYICNIQTRLAKLEEECLDLHSVNRSQAARIAEMEEAQRWRSCETEPPPRNWAHYLCDVPSTKVPLVLYQRDGLWLDKDGLERDPTTWRPI